MEDSTTKKKSPKLVIALVTALLLVAGGSASAFFLFNKSPKVQYLMAESTSLQLMGELFNERYENEMQWIDVQKKKPVETVYNLSAEWNEPDVPYGMEEIQSVVNGIKLSLKNVQDPIKKEAEIELSGELGSVSTSLGKVYATTEKLLFSLPFTEELIRFDDNDFGRMMRESDENYEGPESIGLSRLFEGNYYATGELNTYLRKEYLEFIYNELPDSAFTSEKENIVVFDKKINAKKLTMNLSEEEVKSLLKKLLTKMKDDEKLKGLLKEELAMSSLSGDLSSSEITDFFSDYEEGLSEAIDGIDSISISEGIRSTIWHHSNHIVKRDFAMKNGEFEDEETTISIKGVQLLEKDMQKWEYTFAGTDTYDEEQSFKFKGDMKWKDKKADDSITVSAEDGKFVYKGKEALDGKKRTFTRSFGFSDGETTPKIVWSGSATHESDSMKADHAFTVKDLGFNEDMYNLNLKQKAKIVKKVDLPKENSDTVILKDMDINEIESYITEELGPKMQTWLMELMGDVESELYN